MEIIDLQSFPSVNYLSALIKSSYLEFEQYERWQKMSFRNRYWVAGSGGRIELSIPLEGGREFRGNYRDVRIADDSAWKVHHWRTIVSCYNRSPWFEFYRDSLEALVMSANEFLFDWNLASFDWVNQQLKKPFSYGLTDSYFGNYPDNVTDLRNRFTPKRLRDQPDSTITYRQVFEDRIGFISGLSILDLLFCEGTHAPNVLRQMGEEYAGFTRP